MTAPVASRGAAPVEPRTTTPRQVNWREEYGISHIALIPDGNRRWASEHSLPTELGHTKGLLEVMPALVQKLSDAGVHTLTAWGFSTENWNRETAEVNHLMAICVEFLKNRLLGIAERHGARVVHLGRKDRVPPEVRDALQYVEEATALHESHVYNLAFDYGGRDELTRASVRMLEAQRAGAAESELRLENFLDTRGQPHPEPDLVVRSSGEHRMSGFMPWQTAYSEIFFVERYFPDFDFELIQGIAEQFRARKRRFGG
ncbi:MAG TPA: polyprenyl diphosphate synthase [Polyangiaceae bacterium]